MLVRGSGHLLWAQWGLWASLHRSPTCPTHGSGTRPRSTRPGSGSGLCAGRRGRRGGTCSAAGSRLRSALGGTLQGRGRARVPLPGAGLRSPRPAHASRTQSLGPHVLAKERWRHRSHCRSEVTPQDNAPPHQGAVSGHRGEGWTRPAGRPAWLPQTPSAPCSPLPAQRSPFSQARPVQPSGQVQWPETASQVPPCWQRQACRQPSPCRPSGQAGRPRGQRGAAPASQARRGPEPPWGGPARRPASDLVRRPHPGRPAPGHLGPPAQPSWALCTTSPGPGPPLGKSYIHPVSQETLQGPARGAHTPAGKWAWLTLQAAGACPAGATVTLSMDWVTGGPMEAGASLAAVVPIGEGWAGCRGEARQGSGRWALERAAADRGRWADPLGPRGLCGYSVPPSGLCVTQSGRK